MQVSVELQEENLRRQLPKNRCIADLGFPMDSADERYHQ